MNGQRVTAVATTANPTMERPVRARSLLVDYSKCRVREEELKPLDALLPSANSQQTYGIRRMSTGGLNMSSPPPTAEKTFLSDAVSLHELVRGGRRQMGSVKPIEEGLEGSDSSFNLPELAPMDQQHQQDTSLLGKRDEDELENDSVGSSFANDNSGTPLASPKPATPVRAVSGGRRSHLVGTRMHQSMSCLNWSSSLTGSPSTVAIADTNVLSFSLRRPRNGGGLGRSVTMDACVESTADRFHKSFREIKLEDLDATTVHSSMSHHVSAAVTNPSQNRRAMLFRHSSVSALQSTENQIPLSLDVMASPSTTRSTRSRRVFQKPGPSEKADASRVLPGTIEIKSRVLDDESGRHASSRTLGRHSPRSTMPTGRRSSSTQTSSTNGRGGDKLGNSSHHSGRVSRHRSSATLPRHSGHSREVRGSRTMPTLSTSGEDPMMSASTQSYFDKHASTSSPRPAPSRRDILARQLASRRSTGLNVKSHRTSMSSHGGCGPASHHSFSYNDENGNLRMDDSSHFVTGSRIRRGGSCRQLLC